ncbi:hypothetical protein WICPIJ_007633 [Wickerhamomyces pijperi]|uniref:Uncharacterized protein n=1 Tax=Wickerhamomyces pijperi TaxID=599730 RepID=A0A9P8Q1F2_WICPI|nr:hypothetical protein WICPIJ_007633 [Wickerhamomyces pijperi]
MIKINRNFRKIWKSVKTKYSNCDMIKVLECRVAAAEIFCCGLDFFDGYLSIPDIFCLKVGLAIGTGFVD